MIAYLYSKFIRVATGVNDDENNFVLEGYWPQAGLVQRLDVGCGSRFRGRCELRRGLRKVRAQRVNGTEQEGAKAEAERGTSVGRSCSGRGNRAASACSPTCNAGQAIAAGLKKGVHLRRRVLQIARKNLN